VSQKRVAPVNLSNDVWMIDLLEQGFTCRTAAYIILDEEITLIETGSAASHGALLDGLAALHLTPQDLQHIIVTHVHLDHAGGAGKLMALASNATLHVHPRGLRHMIDPSRLWQGAAQVYGDRLVALFDSVQPTPAERIVAHPHGDTLSIGQRSLTFYDAPGHAKHHFVIHDSLSDALFAGDAVGVRYRSCFTGWDFEWVMPSSSPVDFDVNAVQQTMAMLADVPFTWVYHTHFGKSPRNEAIAETLRCAQAFATLIEQVYQPEIAVEAVIAALQLWVRTDLRDRGYDTGDDLSILDVDIVLDALGLIYYEQERLKKANA